jgi:hypothetical protein
MERPIWYIFALTFGIGTLLIFGVNKLFTPLDIKLETEAGLMNDVDSLGVVYKCYTYELAPDTSFSAVEHKVKWRIGEDKWIIDDAIVDEIMFREEGRIPVEMYVDGKLRGSREIVVEDCPGALVSMPSNVRKGDTHRFRDNTKNSRARKWFVKNSVSSEFKEYDDQGGVLDFEFDYSGPYVIKAEVETDDTTYVFEKRLLVAERIVEKKKVPTESKPDPKPKTESTAYEKPKDKPKQTEKNPIVEEETTEVVVIEEEELKEPSKDVSGSITDYFGRSVMVDDSWNVEESTWFYGSEECLSFNGDKRTLFMRNLKADLCITNLYFVPNLDITGNKVRISIENTKDIDRKFMKKPIVRTLSRSNNGMLSTVNVKSIGCYLKKGESYKIIVDPEPDNEVGEIDKSDYSCIEGMEGFKHADIQVQSKTKILKIEYKVRE